ncbi:MAG: hypothetical protein FD160_4114, partial [Caulobacteraceae bacterium]
AAVATALAFSGAWALSVQATGDGAYVRELLLGEGLAKAWDKYPEPPWYYLGVFPPRFLPWSLLLPLSIVELVRSWRDPDPQRRRAVRVAALLPAVGLLALSCMSAKREQYLLPVYPFAALHVAGALGPWLRGEGWLPEWFGRRASAAIWRRRVVPAFAGALVLIAVSLFVWRGAGLFVRQDMNRPLLEWIRSHAPAHARLVAYQVQPEAFAIEWPTIGSFAESESDLRAAVEAGVEFVLSKRVLVRALAPALRARFERMAGQMEERGEDPMEIYRVVRSQP